MAENSKAGWGIYNPRLDPGRIALRRFGRNHDKPCVRSEVLTCAIPRCQNANECRWTTHSPETTNG